MVRDRAGRLAAAGWSVLAAALVWGALVLPSSVAQLTWVSLVSLPLTLLVGLAVLIVVPRVARPAVAMTLGALLALVVVLKALDIGFSVVADRRFHVYYDLTNLVRGYEVLSGWAGPGWAVLAVVASVVATLLLAALLVLAMARLARLVTVHRTRAVVVLLVGTLAGGTLAATGAQVAGEPVTSRATAQLVHDHVADGVNDYRDEGVFAEAIATDPVAARAGSLRGLAGKDVLVVFVESYGRAALRDPELAKGVTPVLTAGEQSLGEVGFTARSAWLTSPTFGAGSWLAHASLQSGLWVDSDRRHDQLLSSDRLTLTRAFDDAGWRTSFVQPAVQEQWPQGQAFYGFDELYAADDLDYRGPPLGWGGVPDQYTLSWFQREVLSQGDGPVMAEIDLVTSHNPWPQPPPQVPWEGVGDGSVYACMPGCADEGDDDVRSRYAASIGYSLESVISFVVEHPDPDLVVLLVGDHQPWGHVAGEEAGHDVPVSLITGDPAVRDAMAWWLWTPGLVPQEQSPQWRMDIVRDHFLRAFSTPPAVGHDPFGQLSGTSTPPVTTGSPSGAKSAHESRGR
ncbi:sulfatase [Janibacter cremeus]|uniref:Sulfatase n=1 Tax=Janibacter cremeus TaxID=1285192 RepID=A0A852VLD0_9MICO|nr:sulfatase [Janibacter cremeus]NYF96876.1 hypothetical protein [Janibacter cremeus]